MGVLVGEHTGVVSFSRLEHVTVTSVDDAETACCHGAQEELVEIVLIELRAVKETDSSEGLITYLLESRLFQGIAPSAGP